MTNLHQKLYVFSLDDTQKFSFSNLPKVKVHVNGIHNEEISFKELFEKINGITGNVIKGYSFLELGNLKQGDVGILLNGTAISFSSEGKKLSLFQIKNPAIISNDLVIKKTDSDFISNLSVSILELVKNKHDFLVKEQYTLIPIKKGSKEFIFAYTEDSEPFLFSRNETGQVIENTLIEEGQTNNTIVFEVKNDNPFEFVFNFKQNKILL